MSNIYTCCCALRYLPHLALSPKYIPLYLLLYFLVLVMLTVQLIVMDC